MIGSNSDRQYMSCGMALSFNKPNVSFKIRQSKNVGITYLLTYSMMQNPS